MPAPYVWQEVEEGKRLTEANVLELAQLTDGRALVDATEQGYQGLADQVTLVTVRNVETGEEQQIPRITVQTPIKKPKGQELTDEQKAFKSLSFSGLLAGQSVRYKDGLPGRDAAGTAKSTCHRSTALQSQRLHLE